MIHSVGDPDRGAMGGAYSVVEPIFKIDDGHNGELAGFPRQNMSVTVGSIQDASGKNHLATIEINMDGYWPIQIHAMIDNQVESIYRSKGPLDPAN